jgi:hypothetical protein
MDEAPYRIAALKPPVPPDPYLRAWRRLRIWRRLIVGAYIAIGALLLLMFLAPMLKPWVLLSFLPTVAVLFVSHVAVTFFRCPRCRDSFTLPADLRLMDGRASLFRGVCPHCGIIIDTPEHSLEQPGAPSTVSVRMAPDPQHDDEDDHASGPGLEYEDVAGSAHENEKG